jgi:D-alanyl-D-alanine carboxypeptidase (penicillin-binding protein 5/6)
MRAVLVLGVLAATGPLLGAPAVASAVEPTPAPTPGATTPAAAVQPPCSIRDRTSVFLPTPSPEPTHKPGVPTIGGDALAGNGLAVAPGAPALPANLAATSWIVADLDSGEVLGACGAHRMLAPASVQKLLLLSSVLPKLNPSDTTTITDGDLNIEPGSSAVGLILGGQYTVEQLYLGLLLNSGNDCANTLARLGGGAAGMAGGIANMNAEARRLGAWDTHAETPSGLDGPGQVTSAYDLALIFRNDFGSENFRRYIHSETAQMPPEPPKDPDGFQIQNDNRLLYEYPGALGGKTGFTDIARHTYVGAAERDGRRLVVTILGAEIMPVRGYVQAEGLLDWGFAQPRGTSVGKLLEPGEADALMAAKGGSVPVPVAAHDDAPVLPGDTGGMMLVATGIGAIAVGGLAVTAVGVARRRRRRNESGAGTVLEATVPTPGSEESS